MCAFHHSPQIVSTGLALLLDAKNPKSYPGSGASMFDLSGNSNNCSFSTAGIGTSIPGQLTFNGTSEYCTVGNSDSINLDDSMSAFAFIKPDDTSGRQNIITKAYQTSYGGYAMAINGSNLSFRRNPTTGSYNYVEKTAGISTTNWQSVAVTYGTAGAEFYKNGANIGTDTGYDLIQISNGLVIGKYASSTYYFDGGIAYILIYNRILTPAEVLQNHNALKGRFGL
jgi:hypothetical protein